MSNFGSWAPKGYIKDCQKPSLWILWLTSENSKNMWGFIYMSTCKKWAKIVLYPCECRKKNLLFEPLHRNQMATQWIAIIFTFYWILHWNWHRASDDTFATPVLHCNTHKNIPPGLTLTCYWGGGRHLTFLGGWRLAHNWK